MSYLHKFLQICNNFVVPRQRLTPLHERKYLGSLDLNSFAKISSSHWQRIKELQYTHSRANLSWLDRRSRTHGTIALKVQFLRHFVLGGLGHHNEATGQIGQAKQCLSSKSQRITAVGVNVIKRGYFGCGVLLSHVGPGCRRNATAVVRYFNGVNALIEQSDWWTVTQQQMKE